MDLRQSANEVTITKFDAAATGGMTPQKLFTNFYDKDFLYKLNGEKKIGTRLVQEIEMTPLTKQKILQDISLYRQSFKDTL